MDIRKIKKLIELVEESGISELEISEGEESVRISRAAPARQSFCAPERATGGSGRWAERVISRTVSCVQT